MENNRKKGVMIGVVVAVTLVLMFGASFALLKYSNTINNQSVVAGDIYMKYTNGKEIVLNSLEPRDTYDENSYFEFKIEGKNEYQKDILYDVVLSYGDPVSGRTERIKDYLLKFRLVEIINGEEKVVVDDQSYNNLQNRKIYVNTIKANTTENVDITYRLYMWVASGLILVGNTEDAIYDIDTWNNQVFASINVSVNGDFNEKELPLTASQTVIKAIENHTTDSCTPTVTDDNGTPEDESDDTIYFSGTNDCVNFNYVWYSGKLWRIVAINPDGSMKLVTQDTITAITWGETTTYKDSWIREWLNEDFKDTLYNYQNIIVQNADWNATEDRTETPVRPPTDKSAEIVKGDVGLLNAYEYYQSYKNTSYEEGYLNIGYYWWLITRYSDLFVRDVTHLGYLNNDSPSSYAFEVRPSVNLKSNIEIVVGGDGSKTNPYRITGDKESGNIGELINTRLSGEYVKVDNKIYRIVGIENGTLATDSFEQTQC